MQNTNNSIYASIFSGYKEHWVKVTGKCRVVAKNSVRDNILTLPIEVGIRAIYQHS